MGRPRNDDRPKTQWTDSNGRVLDEYGLSSFCVNALRDAEKAGIPAHFLHSSGWNGDENNLQGYYTHFVYMMADFLSTVQTDIDQVESEVLKPLAWLCGRFNVDHRVAMSGIFDAARLLRDLRDGREGRPARPAEIQAISDSWDSVVCGEWGCPSGPGHDSHGHGFSNGSWTCLESDSEVT